MCSKKWKRILWSSRNTRKYLLFACIFLVFLWILNWYKFYQRHKLQNNDPVTHVFIPKPFARPERYNANKNFLNDTKIAVLVMAATRVAAIDNHLTQLLKYRPNSEKFPIIISQDGNNHGVTETIKRFVNDTNNIRFIHHNERTGVGSPSQVSAKNYFYIAQHYKWALDKVFNEFGYKTVIITEDDLDIAEDFFSYFSSTLHLLYEDPSIWCISAWNDNGAAKLTDRSKSDKLYRTDFFPGLGWMLTSNTWNELSVKWPDAYWDDWLRRQDIRRNRVCIRPEVSRTAHNNKLAGKGSSNGMYKKFLESIGLPDSPIDFSLVNTEILKKQNYDPYFGSLILASKEITIDELINRKEPLIKDISYRIRYKDPREYRNIAKAFNLMNDIRSGMARTAYYGAIPFKVDESQVYAIHNDLDLSKPFGSYPTSQLYNDEWDKMTKYLDFAEFYCRPSRWKGKCDPHDKAMINWFAKRGQSKRLKAWGEMIVI